MLEPRTHFEQIPLETVRKIVEEQIQRETAAEQDPGTKEMTLQEDLLRAQEQSMTSSRTIPRLEV
jgi:uncharacterized protein YheU (UPF0270 family)